MDSNDQFSATALLERIDALELMVNQRLHVVEGRLAYLDQVVASAAEPTRLFDEARPAGAPTFEPVQHPWSEPVPAPDLPSPTTQAVPAQAPYPVATPVGVAGAAPPPPAPGSRVDVVVPPQPPQPAAAHPRVEKKPLDVEALLRWVGVGLVTLAAIFLVGTAIDRGWLTPAMQLAGAALAGVSLLGGALYFVEKRLSWATAMGVGGSIVVISAAAASYGWQEMVAPGVALALVGVALAASLAAAWRIDSDAVGAIGAGAAIVAPVDAYDVLPSVVPPLWVLAVMGTGLAIGLVRDWPGIRLLSGWVGALMIFGLAARVGNGDASIGVGLLGVIGGSVLLLVGPLLAERSDGNATAERGDLRAFDLRSLALVPAFAWVAVLVMSDGSSDTGLGVVGLVVGAAFLAIAALVWLASSKVGALSIGLGASGVIAIALATMLDAPLLMVVLAAQAVASFVLARVLDDEPLRWSAYLLGAVASAIAVAATFDAISNDGFDTVGVALAAFVVGALWAVAAWFGFTKDGTSSQRFSVPFIGAWIGLVIWLLAALLAVPQGLSLTSAAWAVMAGAGLVVGLTQRIDIVRAAGLATLALTLGKLFTVDLAEVDAFVRVALFFVVGVGLIGLGLKVPNLMSRGSSDEADGSANGQSDAPGQPPATTHF